MYTTSSQKKIAIFSYFSTWLSLWSWSLYRVESTKWWSVSWKWWFFRFVVWFMSSSFWLLVLFYLILKTKWYKSKHFKNQCCQLFFIFSKNLLFFRNSLYVYLASKYFVIAIVLAFIVALMIHGYQTESTYRLDFLWKLQASGT